MSLTIDNQRFEESLQEAFDYLQAKRIEEAGGNQTVIDAINDYTIESMVIDILKNPVLKILAEKTAKAWVEINPVRPAATTRNV